MTTHRGTRAHHDQAANAATRFRNELKAFFLRLGTARAPVALFVREDLTVADRGGETELVGTYTRNSTLTEIFDDVAVHLDAQGKAA